MMMMMILMTRHFPKAQRPMQVVCYYLAVLLLSSWRAPAHGSEKDPFFGFTLSV
jgi:hypothetical protein